MSKVKFIGLRFFTVYGEWGRPDMLILKFLDHVKKNKLFLLNNSGNHWRDFTYIDDVTNILARLLDKKYITNQILNICSNNPIRIKDLIKFLNKTFNFNKIKNVKSNKFEVYKTHGSNKKLMKIINFKNFSNIYDKLDNIILWYKKYKNLI